MPNEKLASGILRNDSLGGDEVSVEVWLWLPPGADAGRAVTVLEEETGHPVAVAESTVEGIRLTVTGDRCPPPERTAREAGLRLACLRRLHAEGLLGVQDAVQ